MRREVGYFLPKELTTVTTLSKILAVILFIIFPFVGFFIGMKYQEKIDSNKTVSNINSKIPTTMPTPTSSKNNNIYQCITNQDCISIKADVCGCLQGGRATAINKVFIQEWNNQFAKNIMCPQIISMDPSCGGVPKCIENKCGLVNK